MPRSQRTKTRLAGLSHFTGTERTSIRNNQRRSLIAHLLATAGLVGGLLTTAAVTVAPPASADSTGCQATNTKSGLTSTNLQAVIDAAHSGATIRLSGTCIGQFDIPGTGNATNLTLVGPAILDGGGANSLVGFGRVLTVNAQATLVSLTIQDGNMVGVSPETGGGIYNDATLNLDHTSVSGNRAGIAGAGIYNDGTLTLHHSSVSGNTAYPNAVAGGPGGGIYNDGTLTLDRSSVSGNTSRSVGGGIDNTGAATLNNSSVSTNHTRTGAAIANSGRITINRSVVSGNVSSSPAGGLGGISNSGTAIVNDSTVSDNGGGIGGGGIYNTSSLIVKHSSVTGNMVTGPDGGGGIWNGGGTATIKDSSISDDSASPDGGGIYNGAAAVLTLRHTSVTGDSAGVTGGGIYNLGTLHLHNSLVTNDTPNDIAP